MKSHQFIAHSKSGEGFLAEAVECSCCREVFLITLRHLPCFCPYCGRRFIGFGESTVYFECRRPKED
jgi:hypothetical protein